MYARLVRFEGAEPSVLEQELEQMRAQMQGGEESGSGGGPDAAQLEAIRRLVKRVLVLADRSKGSSAMLVFCDTEDEVRELDAMFDQMSPSTGGGSRQSVDIYEVAIEQGFGG